ncbi:MAG: PHP domain-containing protein, partial [Ktedonobacterales bacterium]
LMTLPPQIERIDLHTHSTASDGLYPPTELVRLAHEAKLDLIALTDHDTTGGVEAAQAAGAALGVTVVPGVEINTTIRDGLGEAHVLGYFVAPDDASLIANLGILREARERRGERMVEKLRAAGYDITWARVRELAQGTVGRPHIARALIEKGYASSVADAFDRFISWGKPGYVPRYQIAPDQAIHIIRSAGGVPTLAHPGHTPELAETVLPSLVAAGLLGLECYYGQYDKATVKRLVALADRFGLVATGGSDYHGPNIHPTPLGGRYVPPQTIERLRAAAEQLRTAPAESYALPTPKL